uniref:Uncharacterized protein n=1 Tax=Laurencia verruciformis TaxID=3073068 RepID=A0AA51NF69_9FLOR|nr:hypothetical protein RU989_pgp187 [Laurencia obtusa]WMP12181.1 hypothetical protein [Laurencia verruciformis]WMP12824.1 hypothetical protein [Laurencia obtusa]
MLDTSQVILLVSYIITRFHLACKVFLKKFFSSVGLIY